VVPGAPRHVTQRGNRREPIFLQPGDETAYLDLMSGPLRRRRVARWAHRLTPNHVRVILTPEDETGLARAVGEAHGRHTGFVGARGGWTGHLFQGRFGAVAMDEDQLMAAFRHVALDPAGAGLVARAADWPWSSVAAHNAGRSTPPVTVDPALERLGDFAAFLAGDTADEPMWADLLKAEPVGAKAWIDTLEARLGRPRSPRRRGPRPRKPGETPPDMEDRFGVRYPVPETRNPKRETRNRDTRLDLSTDYRY
jgi:putative transposase